MAKSPLDKVHSAVSGAVRDAVADPAGTATKAAQQAKGALALGLTVAGQVAQTVADRLLRTPTPPPPSAPGPVIPPREKKPTPADVARVVEPKPPAKKAPAKKTPAKKAATPSGKLPAKKAPAKKAPAKKTPAKKTPSAGTEA